jgi:exopolyphosphatase/guanosine-5'-triphosphate,3'-diphosphate pyrophosphatase
VNSCALITLGSNSFSLWLVRQNQVVHKEKIQVHFLKRISPDGHLHPTQIKNALKALNTFAQSIATESLSNPQIFVYATASLRAPTDAHLFIQLVQRQLNWTIQVLRPDQECEFVFQGATLGQAMTEPQLIIDIGGGSTEIVLGDQTGIIDSLSLPFGCHNSRQHWLGDTLQATDLTYVLQQLKILLPEAWQHKTLPKRIYGTSGIIRSLLHLLDYHGLPLQITPQVRTKFLAQLQGCSIDMPNLPELDTDRKASFVAGLLLLHALSQLLGFDEVLQSNGGLREGLLAHITRAPSSQSQA